jgi:energy-coupling factor transporter ATP-binding protein EcfA2
MSKKLNDILRELIDLLAKVPRLRERAGRDAWLSKSLPSNVEDQIRRHNNCKNDLTFIIDGVQNIRLQDDRWVILILLDDLLNELRGITLGDNIEDMREKIAVTLERPSKEPKGESKKLPQPEPSPSGDPKRQEWLERLGFKRDPFLYRDGGTDRFLREYFYFEMKHFYDILGDVSRPGTIFVFGPPGSGKSSMRNVISQLCRTENILPVVYQDFGPLVREYQERERIQVDDHVTQVLKTALRTLAELAKELDEEDVSSLETEETKIICNQLWLYVSKYENDPLRNHTLKNLLKPDPQVEGTLPDDARELLGSFCQYVTKLPGYRFVYILVDPEDDFALDEDIIWQVLNLLLSTRRLLELSENNVAFKFFLSQRFQERALQILWIEQEQGRRVYRLEWPDEELRALLWKRLVQCSEGRYRSLGELSEVDNLDDRVIRLSTGSPRELIVICDRLFSEHCRKWSPDDGEPLLISAWEVDEALKLFEKQYPKSPLEQLIAEGESEGVEFKSTMRYNLKADRPDKEMEREVARTLCAFMNTEGGTLIIGVDDDGAIVGLDKDFSTLGRRKNKDGFEQAFVNITENLFTSPVSPDDYTARFEECQGKLIYVIKVKKSKKPIFCLLDGVSEFYVRKQTTTRKLDPKDTWDYGLNHFTS